MTSQFEELGLLQQSVRPVCALTTWHWVTVLALL